MVAHLLVPGSTCRRARPACLGGGCSVLGGHGDIRCVARTAPGAQRCRRSLCGQTDGSCLPWPLALGPGCGIAGLLATSPPAPARRDADADADALCPSIGHRPTPIAFAIGGSEHSDARWFSCTAPRCDRCGVTSHYWPVVPVGAHTRCERIVLNRRDRCSSVSSGARTRLARQLLLNPRHRPRAASGLAGMILERRSSGRFSLKQARGGRV
ncbi:hypothetical protein C8Q79DRAFT_538965 [Trametes meyenii]|nr:hypothetical protein C8Q79DRAFT_538965 [Trametes meyenii]